MLMLMQLALILASAASVASYSFSPTARALAATTSRRAVGVRCQASTDLPPGWKEVTDKDSGKAYYYNAATGVTQWQKPMVSRFAGGAENEKRTLTPDCSWRIRLDLTAPGCATPVSISGSFRFAEEEGFEPPQGFTLVESCVPEGAISLGQQKARWQLSEDPDDKGDSLWIWGLFSEPLYPFLLLEIELAEPLAMPVEGVSIPAGTLYCQIDHRRKDGAVQLGEGTVAYKVEEKINADLVGLSQVTYNEPVPCGTIRFLDTVEVIGKSYV